MLERVTTRNQDIGDLQIATLHSYISRLLTRPDSNISPRLLIEATLYTHTNTNVKHATKLHTCVFISFAYSAIVFETTVAA